MPSGQRRGDHWSSTFPSVVYPFNGSLDIISSQFFSFRMFTFILATQTLPLFLDLAVSSIFTLIKKLKSSFLTFTKRRNCNFLDIPRFYVDISRRLQNHFLKFHKNLSSKIYLNLLLLYIFTILCTALHNNTTPPPPAPI